MTKLKSVIVGEDGPINEVVDLIISLVRESRLRIVEFIMSGGE